MLYDIYKSLQKHYFAHCSSKPNPRIIVIKSSGVGSAMLLALIVTNGVLFLVVFASPVLVPLGFAISWWENSQYDPSVTAIENYHRHPTYENMKRAHEAGQLYRYDSKGNRINSRDERCNNARTRGWSAEDTAEACAHQTQGTTTQPAVEPDPLPTNRIDFWGPK